MKWESFSYKTRPEPHSAALPYTVYGIREVKGKRRLALDMSRDDAQRLVREHNKVLKKAQS